MEPKGLGKFVDMEIDEIFIDPPLLTSPLTNLVGAAIFLDTENISVGEKINFDGFSFIANFPPRLSMLSSKSLERK